MLIRLHSAWGNQGVGTVAPTDENDPEYLRIHRVIARADRMAGTPESLDEIAAGVTEVVGFGVAAISHLRDDGMFEVIAVSGDDGAREELMGRKTASEDIERELKNAEHWGLLLYVPHDKVDEEFLETGWIPATTYGDAPDAWHPLDLLIAPLTDDTGRMRGMLSVDLPPGGVHPDLERRELLEMYAVQASRAVAGLMQRAKLAEKLRLHDAVRTIVRSASEHSDLTRIIEESQAAVVRGFGITGMWIRTFDEQGVGEGVVYAAHGPVTEIPPEIVTVANRAAERCWSLQQVGIVDRAHDPAGLLDADTHARVIAFFDSIPVSSALFVPLGAGPECLGTLVLTRDREADTGWSEAEIESAMDIGRDLGRVVLNARLYLREQKVVAHLQELDTYKSQLVATLAHELKNPVGAILGHVEILEEAPDLDVPTRRSLGAIERGASRINRLVEDLLLLAKVEDPHLRRAAVPVDLVRLATDVVELIETAASRKQVTVTASYPDAPVVTWGDPAELDIVCANLISNAVKYSPPGRAVNVTVGQDDGQVVLTCADQGLGISEADQSRLFTEFFRSTNPAAVAEPGTGLGLAIVRRIVARHHGEIQLVSALGEGATFTVRLPTPPISHPTLDVLDRLADAPVGAAAAGVADRVDA